MSVGARDLLETKPHRNGAAFRQHAFKRPLGSAFEYVLFWLVSNQTERLDKYEHFSQLN